MCKETFVSYQLYTTSEPGLNMAYTRSKLGPNQDLTGSGSGLRETGVFDFKH